MISVIFTFCCIGLIIKSSLLLKKEHAKFLIQCSCVTDNCNVTASHKSDGHTHETHGHKTTTSSEHAEEREEHDKENQRITEKTGIFWTIVATFL